ncbi:hypothetical protein B0H13DRAFT_2319735 [Mycena leptocephala]|nr:hypothetical protein B0H13DRAFT_2319735 [Mycena leptocephala]
MTQFPNTLPHLHTLLHSRALPPHLESAMLVASTDCLTCPMLYYPDARINQVQHSQDAKKYFYIVKEGCVRGTFTNDEVARLHTTCFSSTSMRAVGRWEDTVNKWNQHCIAHHGDVCPDALIAPSPPAAPSRAPSLASSLSSFSSLSSVTTTTTEPDGFAWQLPHGQLKCSGEFLASCVPSIPEQGIMRPNIWGHADQHVMADFILSGEQYI